MSAVIVPSEPDDVEPPAMASPFLMGCGFPVVTANTPAHTLMILFLRRSKLHVLPSGKIVSILI